MDIRQLRYFVATIEEGSLHGAAQRLRVAQPALSRRIRDLEANLGCDILVRSPRGIVPTHAGATLYRDAVQLLEGLEQAGRRARQAGSEEQGVIRMGLMPTVRKFPFVRDAFLRYGIGSSDRDMTFTRASSADLAGAMREGQLDLALLYERHLASPEFGECIIHNESYVLAVHPSHSLAVSAPIEIADLAGERFVWLSRHDTEGAQDRLLQACRLHGLEPSIGHVAQSLDEQFDLAVISGGLCLTPASTILSLPRGQLIFRPLLHFRMEVPLSLVWRRALTDLPAARLLAVFQQAIEAHQSAMRNECPQWNWLCGMQVATAGNASI